MTISQSAEKVAVGTSAEQSQNQNIIVIIIDEKPIRPDMTFMKSGIITDWNMIVILWRQRFLIYAFQKNIEAFLL